MRSARSCCLSVSCRSPKLDRASVEAAFAAILSVDVANPRFIAKINQHGMVLIIDPAPEGHQNSSLAARLIYPYTNPPAAPRRSPHTIRTELRPRPRRYHILGSIRSSAPESG